MLSEPQGWLEGSVDLLQDSEKCLHQDVFRGPWLYYSSKGSVIYISMFLRVTHYQVDNRPQD